MTRARTKKAQEALAHMDLQSSLTQEVQFVVVSL